MNIQKLTEIGGSEWIRDDKHRIYFNLDVMVKMINLDVSFYKTGNIQSARLNGETISNGEANRILHSIDGKLYYDVNADGWKSTLPNTDRAREIKTVILKSIEN